MLEISHFVSCYLYLTLINSPLTLFHPCPPLLISPSLHFLPVIIIRVMSVHRHMDAVFLVQALLNLTPDGPFLSGCQFSHPQSITAVGCVRVCVFFSAQIREELKLTSISATRLAFISSASEWTVRGTGRHERAGECCGDKRKALEKPCCPSARLFCAY